MQVTSASYVRQSDILWTANMFFRVYALYGRSKRIAIFAAIVFGALIGVCGVRCMISVVVQISDVLLQVAIDWTEIFDGHRRWMPHSPCHVSNHYLPGCIYLCHPLVGQVSDIPLSPDIVQLNLVALAVAWEELLALDFLIFFLTFFKTYTAAREPQLMVQSGSLLNLMLRDGAFIFFVY